jgi:D-alanyl-D-alanine carboxypeptidase/D-alanyl-D-alanine-endopeptidase (penicillin-binding protein 4)
MVVALVAVAVCVLGFFGGRAVRKLAEEPTASSSSAPSRPPATPSAVSAAAAEPSTKTAVAGVPAAAAKVTALLAPYLRVPALGSTVGAYVADGPSGAILDTRLGSLGFAPASTAKLTTAVALLSVARPDERFTTVAEAGAASGQVVLVGGGDPTLSAARPGKPTDYRSAARMSDLAAQVRKALGGTPITSIVVDDSRFTGPRTASGWQPTDVPSTYASAITPLMVDGGLPATGGSLRSAIPDLEAGRAFARLAGAPTAPVTRGHAAPSARRLGAVNSATMLDLVEQMLKISDNVIAELLGREVARRVQQPPSFTGAAAAITLELAKVGVPSGLHLTDASGLSELDRIAPHSLVALLRAVVNAKNPALGNVVTAMPVAAWDGTLATRFEVGRSKSGAGRVRAKTGTIANVVTLAGIVRDVSGRLLLFAFMARGVPNVDAGERSLDAAAAALARCGCGS